MPPHSLINKTTPVIPSESLGLVQEIARKVAQSLSHVLNGKPEAIDTAITTLFAGGHLLLEDVPGVGKTTLATTLARSIEAASRRIQFTSDMLPTDVTGLSIFDQEKHEFQFHPGPIFTNIVIGDEINRATPKTQSALLEAMGDRSVTIDRHTYRLPELFIVVATQNPQDMEGTFPLPEAQRDRFMTRIALGYPDSVSEIAMLASRGASDPADAIRAVTTVDEVLRAQKIVSQVHLAPEVAQYLVAIVGGTRAHSAVRLGASPRATLHLARMARSRAAMQGRSFVSPDDVASLAGVVLPHRLAPLGRFGSMGDSYQVATDIVAEIAAHTPLR